MMFKRIARWFGSFGRRSYAAASFGRLFSDWIAGLLSANEEIKGGLATIRNRSRDLERNNPWFRRYLYSLVNNVCGSSGIRLQMKIREPDGKGGETYDRRANQIIEGAWAEFGARENFTVDRSMSCQTFDAVGLRTVARDGEVLILPQIDPSVNRFGFAVQMLEADHLDVEHNEILRNGNRVVMGVELAPSRAVVAFHLFARHPGDFSQFGYRQGDRLRVPADRCWHIFRPERPGQVRGVPWSAAIMRSLKMLDSYSFSEVVAARVGANKVGFYTRNQPTDWESNSPDSSGKISDKCEPGTFTELPYGVDVKEFNPDHPNTNYGAFIKDQLRQIASGLNVSYNMLASDLEGVNYSSIRAGLLDEREEWLALQAWWVEVVKRPIFAKWLEVSLLSGAIPLPYSKIEKFHADEWMCRRWAWVDPEKDINAQLAAVRARIKPLRQVIAETGGDIEDVLADCKADDKLLEGMTVDFGGAKPAQPEPPQDAPQPKPQG